MLQSKYARKQEKSLLKKAEAGADLRKEVSSTFRFIVELDGLQAAGFSEVSGLQSEIEYEEIAEGGVNTHFHRLPKRVKSPPLVLKRGLSLSTDLWNWYSSAMNGQITRKTGSIIMYDQDGDELCRWNFAEAYPIKWSGPELNAMRSEVAVESIEIVHNGLTAYDKKRNK
ncbi:phage tail protein [Paenibacillus sp. y28]|uniref:phage tail protein n=1 Tax=Paenibacillus sp. y28 TaxID=3129110 RepID=UPI00301A090F